MQYYFSYISMMYSSGKSSLEKAVREFLKENDRLIIKAGEVEVFKKSIVSTIEKLNKQFPRCKPIEPDWSSPSANDRDITLYLPSGILNFHLYASKD